MGYEAGQANAQGSWNTFVGAVSDPGGGLVNATAIGYAATVSESNAIVLGSINGVNGATSNVNVGIGTTTPSAPLDVVGSLKLEGTGNGITFPDGSTENTATAQGPPSQRPGGRKARAAANSWTGPADQLERPGHKVHRAARCTRLPLVRAMPLPLRLRLLLRCSYTGD